MLTPTLTTTTPRQIPGIWVHTTVDQNTFFRPAPLASFLTADQRSRLERLREGQLLFDGEHRRYFLEEGRTQFDFPRVRTPGGTFRPLYLTYNVLGLISLKGADLLFGQSPILRAKKATEQDAITELADRSNLHPLFYGCAVDASYQGECFLESCMRNGTAYVRQVSADEIFPLGELQPDGQYETYARYRLKNVGTEEAPVYLLLEIIHRPGRIERKCYQLDKDDRRREISLRSWSGDSATPAPVTLTGTSANTITWIPNLLIRGRAVSDYEGAIELQDALNAKNSQVGRALLKHSDPRMSFPEEAFDPTTGDIRTDHEVFAYSDPSRVPQYITWDAALQHAMADRAFVLNQLLVRTETSPVLLGLKEGAAPDAYKKVRLESFNSLTKAARKAAYWRTGIRRAVSVALELQAVARGENGYEPGSIAVQLRDGIPIDENEQAQRLATLRSHGIMSVERALEEQLQDPAAVAKELARLGKPSVI